MSNSILAPSPSTVSRPWSSWLSLLAAGLLLLVVFVLLSTSPAAGFESSIYTAYPVWFWAALVGVLVIGQILIFREGLVEKPNPANWKLGFLLTLLAGTVLAFMPIIRGYPAYGRADFLTHVGHAAAIHETGGHPFHNIYQNLHQLFLALSYATGLDPIQVGNAVAGVISLFSIVATYVLLTAIFDRRRVLLTLPFVVVFVAGTTHLNPSPYAQSVLLLPFLLYLFVKTQQTERFVYRLALVLAVIAAVLYHPLFALFLLAIFLIHYAVVYRSTAGERLQATQTVSRVSATSVLQLTAVTFIAWYYNFAGIIIRMDSVFRRLLDPGESETALDTYGQTVADVSPSVVDLARVGLFRYGQRALLLGIGTLFVLLALRNYLNGRRFETPYLWTFLFGFITFSAFGVLFLYVDLIGGFGRPMVIAQFFAAITAGTLISQAYSTLGRERALTVVIILGVVVLSAVSVITLYQSPMGGESTSQVTEQDISGAEWYLENDLQTAPLQEYGTTMYRFEHALVNSSSNTVQRVDTAPPPHFNYTNYEHVGDGYTVDTYLVVTERGVQFYPSAYPGYESFWLFTDEDFDRLSRDPTVAHVYGTDEFDIYRIQATGDP